MNKKGAISFSQIVYAAMTAAVVVAVIYLIADVFNPLELLAPILGFKAIDLTGFKETGMDSSTSFGDLVNTFQYCGALDEEECYCRINFGGLPFDTYTFIALNEESEEAGFLEVDDSKKVAISAETQNKKTIVDAHLCHIDMALSKPPGEEECFSYYKGGQVGTTSHAYKTELKINAEGTVFSADNRGTNQEVSDVKEFFVINSQTGNCLVADYCTLEERKMTTLKPCETATEKMNDIFGILKLVDAAVQNCIKKQDVFVCEFMDFKERNFDDPKFKIKQEGNIFSLWYDTKKINELEIKNIFGKDAEFKGGEGVYLLNAPYTGGFEGRSVEISGQEEYYSAPPRNQIVGLAPPIQNIKLKTFQGLEKINAEVKTDTEPEMPLPAQKPDIKPIYFRINLESESKIFKGKLDSEYVSDVSMSFVIDETWVSGLPEGTTNKDIRLYYYDEGAWKPAETYCEFMPCTAHLDGFSTEFAVYVKQEKIWPLDSQIITSCYGWRDIGKEDWHDGIDLKAGVGTDVKAVDYGKVIETCVETRRTYPNRGNCRGYGTYLIIKHYDGTYTKYSHLSKLLVEKGDSVSQGEVIAESGNTGYSMGPHLDFKFDDNPYFREKEGDLTRDPLAYLPELPLYPRTAAAKSCEESKIYASLEEEGKTSVVG